MATTKWVLEPTHSEVNFKVRHMMISNVSGHFKKFDSTVETEDENIETAKVIFTADVDSISTNNEQRDTHLKSADFFDASSHSQIRFESTGLQKKDNNEYSLSGNLTIRATTKPVSFNVEFGGIIKDPWGNVRAGFTVMGRINRKDYGLNWNALTETGGLVVSDDVKFEAHVEYIKS